MELEKAIKSADLEHVKLLLSLDPACIDDVDSEGVAMSFLAARTGDLALLRYIVEYSRASMNIRDPKYRSMLHYGVMSGSVDVSKYLTEKVGLSPVDGDSDLVTPYELSESLGFKDIEKYFEQVVGAPLEKMYKNPVRRGFFPDPSIVRVGEDYYMVNSSFVYFPCIPISHSKDLIHWQVIGHAITNPDWSKLGDLEGGRGYWAPDISYYRGRFYITATYRLNENPEMLRRQIIVSSERAEGPYSEPVYIDEDGIDPSLFADDDGRRYMLLNRGARILELNEDATRQISEAELLYYGDQKRAPEGPHLLKKDGYYYLFEAEGGTGPGHRISVARSRTLKGNYEPCPYNPIMIQRDHEAPIWRCGHGKPVSTPDGRWYMVYLCARKLIGKNGEKLSILGRETAIDPITWTVDGWPVVNNLKGPSCLQVKPVISGDTDDVDSDYMFADWMCVREPQENMFRMSGKDHIFMRSGSRDLCEIGSVSALLRRQTAFDFSAGVTLQVPALRTGQNAGMVCYYDENSYVKFGLFMENDGLYVGVLEHVGRENRADRTRLSSQCTKLRLDIKTVGNARTFAYETCSDAKESGEFVLDSVEYLCDEGLRMGKRFTGAMVGIYAYSGGGEAFTCEFTDFIIA
ncbi:MAG: family 43 glycosylhydrolase [Lachnospiraceae bacterium]|nr:family 43 glycosylhydrolase [Lachnospiraceae bacterium]